MFQLFVINVAIEILIKWRSFAHSHRVIKCNEVEFSFLLIWNTNFAIPRLIAIKWHYAYIYRNHPEPVQGKYLIRIMCGGAAEEVDDDDDEDDDDDSDAAAGAANDQKILAEW